MIKHEKPPVTLVLGGGGFLGSHTADALSEAGHKVRVFDIKPSPYLAPGQEMIVGDMMDPEALSEAAKGCDYIYHFAGIADIDQAKENPIDTCRLNVLGTVQALDIARSAGIKRFVFASTVYVYSNSGAFYRASKQACENFIETYGEMYGLPYTILRYGSLYGRRAGPQNGISRLIRSALEDGRIIYNGDPEAMREYIHVADAAKLSLDILDEKYANRHIILTGHERMRVADLMRMIAEMLPNKPNLVFGDKTLGAHYVMTPYTYTPKVGHKMISTDHIDLGQGILDCIAEMSEDLIRSDLDTTQN